MSASIRRATPTDAARLVELRQILLDEMGAPQTDDWQGPAAAWFVEHIDDPDVCILVAETSGRVEACAVGALQGTIPSPGNPAGTSVYLSNFATEHDARGRGHATRLLDGILAWARTRGIGRADLHATALGRPIYERAGFHETACPSMRMPLR